METFRLSGAQVRCNASASVYIYTVSEDRIKANAIVLPLSLNAEHILSICVTIETYTVLALKLFFFSSSFYCHLKLVVLISEYN